MAKTKLEIKILIYSNRLTIKDIIERYPRTDGAVGVSKAYYYKMLNKDPDTLYEKIKTMLKV